MTKILLPPKPQTYLHGSMVEISNADGNESMRLLIDERSVEDDSIVAPRVDAITISMAEAATDPEIGPHVAPVYEGLKAIALTLLQRHKEKIEAQAAAEIQEEISE